MIEQKDSHVATHTEKNAFPVWKGIIGAVLSLLVVRYLFGMVPLTYPTDKEHMDFYYRGNVLSIASPNGYCYTEQADLIENIVQLVRAVIHYEDPFKYISFRTFRRCESIYENEKLVYGYHRFFSPRYYFEFELQDHSPEHIGFTGVGAELVPSSEENAILWLKSKTLAKTIQSDIWSNKILPYYPQYSSYNESYRSIYEKIIMLNQGKCSISIGQFLEVDFGIDKVIDECKSENGNGCKESIKDIGMNIQNHWESLRNNHKKLNDNVTESVSGFIKLAIYVTSYKGRAIYYGFSEELTPSLNTNAVTDALEWGGNQCRSAENTTHTITLKDTDRGLDTFRN